MEPICRNGAEEVSVDNPPGELKERRVTVRRRRRRCLREIHSGRTSGNDLSFLLLSTALETLVCFGVT